ncbi:MAG: RNA polymerase factor sigma-70 [Epulopiscium sp. Nele67-Bin004]|nr:MAG: RNA polymerase factor sigma-70 [Epulopiscium sp. Nele67-Bin004]
MNHTVLLEDLSDEQLIQLYRNDNIIAIEVLITRYKSYVRGFLHTNYFVGSERDDIVQEGMIGLFKAICDYNPEKETQFKTFAHVCIQRQIFTAYKTNTRKKHIPLNTSISLDQPLSYEDNTLKDTLIDDITPTPEELIILEEEFEIFKKNIKSILSGLEWQVISMYIEGNNYQEIAKLLDKTPKSIDNALQRIKRKLSTRLPELCIKL